ncbi:MAG: hypothetical protein ACRED8_01825, partial [Caulobacteraceae bacterium]
PNADADSDPHSNADAHADSNADAHANADSDSDSDADSDAHAHADAHADAHAAEPFSLFRDWETQRDRAELHVHDRHVARRGAHFGLGDARERQRLQRDGDGSDAGRWIHRIVDGCG